ncbi:MAG: GTP 3',8-cyclase MoaA [Propionibacteriaceae bacterium]|jgi:cyclic pyranopterin phosphate synthase|nr:GTP 3',8-cyclase MoaA [Propionibacteriaceae bacterium]
MTTVVRPAPGAAAGPDRPLSVPRTEPFPDGPLRDRRLGRAHRDLRVSVTDRCPLRCSYCLPAEGIPWLPARSLMTAAEIVRAVGLATGLGLVNVRLTGGEPLARPDLVELVAGIVDLPAAPAVSLTTNGVGLADVAGPLARAGLGRVNVSLDSVDRLRYAAVTGRDRLGLVLEGLEAAREAGLEPIKINAVLLPGVNDGDAEELLAFALARGFELRFIEQMPLDGGRLWRRDRMISAAAILERLGASHRLTALPETTTAPAARWLVDDGPGTVGVIAAVTRPFCARCDRVRLTADGQLRGCLFSDAESDLLGAMRAGASDAELSQIFRLCVADKPAGHGIGRPGFRPPRRPMSAIGG